MAALERNLHLAQIYIHEQILKSCFRRYLQEIFFKERKRMKTWSCLFSNIIKLIWPFLFRVNSDYNNQREQRNQSCINCKNSKLSKYSVLANDCELTLFIFMHIELFCSDLLKVQVTVYSQVVLAWQLLQANTSAQVRKETRGSPRWLELADSQAVVGVSPETEMDSAVSLRGEAGRMSVSCVIRCWRWCWASWRVPGRDEPGDGPDMASKLCSLCLNTSLGLKDRWEINDLASCSESKPQQNQRVFHTRLTYLLGKHVYSRWLSARMEQNWFLSFGFCFPPPSKTQRCSIFK